MTVFGINPAGIASAYWVECQALALVPTCLCLPLQFNFSILRISAVGPPLSHEDSVLLFAT